MTREEIERAQSLLEMPKWLACTHTHIYDSRRDELRSILWKHRRALLCSAEDALRYKKALETVVSIGNGKADGLTVIQMWNEAREALAPKEEPRG